MVRPSIPSRLAPPIRALIAVYLTSSVVAGVPLVSPTSTMPNSTLLRVTPTPPAPTLALLMFAPTVM